MEALTCGDFDLLLAHQGLQRMTGLYLLEFARRHFPRTVGLLLSEDAGAEEARAAVATGGAYACVLRPVRADALHRALSGTVRKSQWEGTLAQVGQALWRVGLDRAPSEAERGCEQAVESLLRSVRALEEENYGLRQQALEMECQARTDPLTGLLNRRAVEAAAEAELARRARRLSPMALGLIDADHFREVNRRYLHPGGDEALVGLARVLAGSLRACDSVGRVGGEEFLVVAPHTDEVGAAALGERLRRAVQQAPIHYNGEVIPLTISIGMAVIEEGGTGDLREARHVAAAALAEAKGAGRNCCVVRPVGGKLRLDDSMGLLVEDAPAGNTVQANGRRVRRLRQQASLTQKDLAQKAGYGKKTIENIEKGLRVQRATLENVAEALGVAAEDLVAAAAHELATTAAAGPGR